MSLVSRQDSPTFDVWRRDWGVAIVTVSVAIGAIGVIFSQEVLGAFRVWMNSTTYNHCFLIFPMSLYMIWRRRERLRDISPRPNLLSALLILPLSVMWLGAAVIGILEAQQFVVMTIIQVTLLGLLGGTVYRRLLAPFLYLYFLVPSGDYLIPALQDFTARFAVFGLQATGIPVFSDGTIIEIPAGTFVVAEACAGLRFLVASVAFGVFFAVETYRSWPRRMAFVGLSIVVPIIANGLRALGLILIAHFAGSGTAIDADHLTFGWVFFSLILVGLIAIGRTFSDVDAPDSVVPTTTQGAGQHVLLTHPTISIVLAALVIVALAAAPSLATSWLFEPAGTVVATDLPEPQAPWRRQPPAQSQSPAQTPWRPVAIGADSEKFEAFGDGQATIERYVALYVPRGRGDNLIRSGNRIADEDVWRRGPGTTVQITSGGQTASISAVEIVAGIERRLVWSFYSVGGVITGQPAEAKWRQVVAYLTGSPCISAFVAVSTPFDPANRVAAEGAMADFMTATSSLPQALCSR